MDAMSKQLEQVRALLWGIGAPELSDTPDPIREPMWVAWVDSRHTWPEVVCYQRDQPAAPLALSAVPCPAAWRDALAARWPVEDAITALGSPSLSVRVPTG